MTPTRSRSLVLALVGLAACRSDEVGPITLAEPPAGSPVRATEVRARLSTIVGLGAVPKDVTAAAESGKNSAGAMFQVRVEQAPPAGLQMANATTCRVGEWTIARPLTWIGDIAGTPVGESRELHAQYMPTMAAPHEPTACEFALYYGSPGTREAPPIEPVKLTTVCWTKDELVEQPCAPELLPREASGDGALAIPALRGGVQERGGHKGYWVGYEYLVTANAEVVDGTRIVGQMRCDVGGELVSGHAGTLTSIDHLAVGESVGGQGQAFLDHPLTATPLHCTLDLESQLGGPQGARTVVSQWCFRDGTTSAGACE